MTPEEIRAICKERLGRWQERLVNEHATPVVLLGVGHDEQKGKLVLLTTEEMTDEEITVFMYGALRAWRHRCEETRSGGS